MKSKDEKKTAFEDRFSHLLREYEKEKAYTDFFTEELAKELLKKEFSYANEENRENFGEFFEEHFENIPKRLQKELAFQLAEAVFRGEKGRFFRQNSGEALENVAFPLNRYTGRVFDSLVFPLKMRETENFEEALELAENGEVSGALLPITDKNGNLLPRMARQLSDSTLKKTLYISLEEEESATGYLFLTRNLIFTGERAVLELLLYPETPMDGAFLLELASDWNLSLEKPKGSDGQLCHFAFSGEEEALCKLIFSSELFLKISPLGLYRRYDCTL